MNHWQIDRLEAAIEGFRLGPVDLSLDPGRAVAVLGASGAGKTTLLRTLAGFHRASGGRLLRDGVDLTHWTPEERSLGYVPQGLGLFPHRTVERNVSYPLEVRDRDDTRVRTRALLEQFGLTALARRYPARLSGGEQQRVALARALAANPSLVVWDEPWQGLDVTARYELGRVLADLREVERVPVIVVTHDPGLAFSLADEFLVLEGGQVRFRGDASALLAAPIDPFVARFAGFDNVYDAETLAAPRPGPFRAWLAAHAGPEGIAFAAGPLGASAPGEGWSATVRSVRPSPHGLLIEAEADDLLVTFRLPAPWSPPVPTLGSTARFAMAAVRLVPLGPGARASSPSSTSPS